MKILSFKYEATPNFVSVIIPVFKDYIGLQDTLVSLQEQTISADHYEIIVANDGGDDKVSSVCDDYGVLQLIIQPNKGAYYARNRALECSKGEFIALVDADIVVPENWLEDGLKALMDADYVGGPVHIDRKKVKTPAHYYDYQNGFQMRKYFDEGHFCGAGNLFVKRKIFENLGGFDERLRSGGDNEFGKRVFFSSLYKQSFCEDIPVLHPPHDFQSLVLKRIRVARGKEKLNNLYPEYFDYKQNSKIALIQDMLLPPRINRVKKSYDTDNPFTFIQYYLFIWKLKFSIGLKMFWTNYGKNAG